MTWYSDVWSFNRQRIGIKHLRGNPEHQRLAAIAAGIIGDPYLVEDLIALMAIEEVTRVAGEAFSMITGVDLEYDDLDGDAPENFEGGPSEEPEDEDVDMDPDEDLPWPVLELVSKWWQEHRKDFQPGIRYLVGKETKTKSLKDCLSQGNQRQRAAAALELALLQPTAPSFEVRANCKSQLRDLSVWTL